jgi:hypothetical protein
MLQRLSAISKMLMEIKSWYQGGQHTKNAAKAAARMIEMSLEERESGKLLALATGMAVNGGVSAAIADMRILYLSARGSDPQDFDDFDKEILEQLKREAKKEALREIKEGGAAKRMKMSVGEEGGASAAINSPDRSGGKNQPPNLPSVAALRKQRQQQHRQDNSGGSSSVGNQRQPSRPPSPPATPPSSSAKGYSRRRRIE